MKTFTFRPYFAHDCDSEMGFNNGYYLNEITVESENADRARDHVIEILGDMFDFNSIDADETQCLDVDAAWTFDHVWRRGNEEHVGRDCPDDDGQGDWDVSYLYKYLDLGDAETD